MNIKELREIKNELLKKDYNAITMLSIIYELDDTTQIEELTEQEQQSLIYKIYNYYIESEGLTIGEILHKVIEWVNWGDNIITPEPEKRLKRLVSFDALEFEYCIDSLI